MARIMRNGETHQKNFTLAQYKSWDKAERAARRWVNKLLRELPPRKSTAGLMTERNSSGIVGVSPRSELSVRNGRSYAYQGWTACYPGCRRGGISFSVSKYGDDDAFVLAALAVELKTVDREVLEKRLKRIRSQKKYARILENKELIFVD